MKTCMQCGATLKDGAAFCRLCGGAASAESFAQADVKYDAFITYRHLPLDRAVAEQTQKLLESFKPPKGIAYANTDRITRIFRDESELPTSNDLGADIHAALEQSRYLIVICSPALPQSKWCLEEIDYFKKLHNGRTNHILPVLIYGSPSESFPELLRYDMRAVTLEDGSQRLMPVEVEPLASNITGNTTADVMKRLKTEFMRLAAPMLGCAFDDLFGRHQRREKQRVRRVVAAVAAAASIFVGTVVYQNVQVQRQRDIAVESEQLAQANERLARGNERLARANEQTALRNQSQALAGRSRQMQMLGSKTLGMLLALEALPDDLRRPEKPFIKEAQWALFENLASETAGMHHEENHVVWPVRRYFISESPIESENGVFHAFFGYPYDFDPDTSDTNSTVLTLINKDTIETKTLGLSGYEGYVSYIFYRGFYGDDYGYFTKDGAYLFINYHRHVDESETDSAYTSVIINTASGEVIYEGSSESRNALIKTASGSAVFEGPGENSVIDDFAISGDGRFLAVSYSRNMWSLTRTGGASIIDLRDNRSTELPPGQPLSFSADNEYFLLRNDDTNRVNLFRIEGGVQQEAEWVFVREFNVEYAYFTESNDIVLLQRSGDKYVVDNNRNVLAGSFFFNENDGTLASITGETSHPGRILFDTAVFYDADTFDVLSEHSVHDVAAEGNSSGRVFRVLSNDGKFIAEYESGNLRLLTASGELLSSADLPSYYDDYLSSNRFAFVNLHSDKYFVLARLNNDGRENIYDVSIFNAKTGERLDDSAYGYPNHIYYGFLPPDLLRTPIRDRIMGQPGEEPHPAFFISHNGEYYINSSGVYEFDTGRNIMGDDFDFYDFISSLAGTPSGSHWNRVYAEFSQTNDSFWFMSAEEFVLFNIINGTAVRETRYEGVFPTMKSPRGIYMAGFNENEGCIWDAATGELITMLTMPAGWHNADDEITVFNDMNKGVFLEDEGVLISGSHIGRIIVWDVETGRILANIDRDWEQIIPRSGRLLVLSEMYAEWIDYRLEALVELAQQLLGGRELTTAERVENYCEID